MVLTDGSIGRIRMYAKPMRLSIRVETHLGHGVCAGNPHPKASEIAADETTNFTSGPRLECEENL